MTKKVVAKQTMPSGVVDLQQVSGPTGLKQRLWLKGKREELDVRRIPTKFLFFNIENGRYADKMIQLRADHSGVHIDPREPKWQNEIFRMLKGEYPGTDQDREPFQKLREDIKHRLQLRPGVVLQDGGVLDGNRRLAVLSDLQKTERNPDQFAYFDGVILPSDVSGPERWRIEAGLQLGRDEQLDYSPINRLLKIREGLELFRREKLPPGKTPEQMVAGSLFGVTSDVIEENIERLRLINQYLHFIKQPDAYHVIGERMERFIEAVNILRGAKKQTRPPDWVDRLKIVLFAHIRDMTMDNWDLRKVLQAMGGVGRGRKPLAANEEALDEFLQLDGNVKKVQEALASSAKASPLATQLADKAQDFLERVEAGKAAGEPIRLAKGAKTKLETLDRALTNPDLTKRQGWSERIRPVPGLLRDAIGLAKKCVQNAQQLQRGRTPTGARKPKRATR